MGISLFDFLMARFLEANSLRGTIVKAIVLAVSLLLLATAAQAADMSHAHVSKYVGQENRAIKSLSANDIAELRRGGGWGLAKAAELNGVPGPAHLLEMKEEIPLTETQVEAITSVYRRMRSDAIELGEKLIGLERELDAHFQNRTINEAILRISLEAIAETRKELRYIHLSAHLETPKLLSEAQISRYNALRGYAAPDPCANVPEGHDLAMWRKQNGCE